MTELNQVFDGDLAEHAFIMASIFFIALYACVVLILRRNKSESRPVRLCRRATIAVLLFAAAVAAASGLGLLKFSESDAAGSVGSIAIDELQKKVDTRSLPATLVDNPI